MKDHTDDEERIGDLSQIRGRLTLSYDAMREPLVLSESARIEIAETAVDGKAIPTFQSRRAGDTPEDEVEPTHTNDPDTEKRSHPVKEQRHPIEADEDDATATTEEERVETRTPPHRTKYQVIPGDAASAEAARAAVTEALRLAAETVKTDPAAETQHSNILARFEIRRDPEGRELAEGEAAAEPAVTKANGYRSISSRFEVRRDADGNEVPYAEARAKVDHVKAPEPDTSEAKVEEAETVEDTNARARNTSSEPPIGVTIEGETGPIKKREDSENLPTAGGGGGVSKPPPFHKRLGSEDFAGALKNGLAAVKRNMIFVLVLTCATNALILAIPVYLFQISDRVLTSRSVDTLVMLTVIIVGAVVFQAIFDAIRRFVLMRTAVELAARLGAPILSAAAHSSLHSNGKEYQTLGDLQTLRGFLVSGTLISFLDVPFAPLFIAAIFLVHPHLGSIVVATSILLFVVAAINQRVTSKPFKAANAAQSKANLHLDSMARNSQIINALAMIPEAVTIWGRDTAASLTAQVKAQDRNITSAAMSRIIRLLTQVAMLGWGAYLAIDGQITGGMVIAASIIAGRALAPIEGAIEGWNAYSLSRMAFGRIQTLLTTSKHQFEKLWLPKPEGRLDVERLLYVPGGTKQVVLNGISFSLNPGETLAVIGNSGAGKTTLGKMLVGSILPTSGNVRLDLMDLRNWDPRQFGENIGYLPQDVQLFPGTIKDNIGRMREDASDADIYEAARLADVHEMIANLPQGYETVVAADGSPLSGGQKQRIALARAFFGNPRFVVLDEPNSNLDTNGDKALARAIKHAQDNQITVVVITQKPSLLSSVDKVMLLADGTIQLFGERQAVLEKLAGRRVNKVPQ